MNDCTVFAVISADESGMRILDEGKTRRSIDFTEITRKRQNVKPEF